MVLLGRTHSHSEQDVLFVAAERLHDVAVHVALGDPTGNAPGVLKLCAHVAGPFASGQTRIVCTNEVVGRYVTISVSGVNDILTLCEVEVYGVPGKATSGYQRTGR